MSKHCKLIKIKFLHMFFDVFYNKYKNINIKYLTLVLKDLIKHYLTYYRIMKCVNPEQNQNR